jgi:4'-phosphopantetheinyl transferase
MRVVEKHLAYEGSGCDVESSETAAPSFGPPPSDLRLMSDEVHIWLGMLDRHEAATNAHLQTLAGDEIARAGRFHFDHDRKRFITRRGALRTIMGQYLGMDKRDVMFEYGKHGKPAVAGACNRENIRFSIAHSAGVALMAFARSHDIGIDIERIRPVPEMDGVVERFFSAGEKAHIRGLPLHERREAFFRVWTRKEAFVKATGEGLSRSFETFDTMRAPGSQAAGRTIDEDLMEILDRSLLPPEPARAYAGALAVDGKRMARRYFNWMPAAPHCDYAYPAICPEEVQ